MAGDVVEQFEERESLETEKRTPSMSIAKIREESSQQVQIISKGQLPPEGSADALCTRFRSPLRAATALAREVRTRISRFQVLKRPNGLSQRVSPRNCSMRGSSTEACESEHGVRRSTCRWLVEACPGVPFLRP